VAEFSIVTGKHSLAMHAPRSPAVMLMFPSAPQLTLGQSRKGRGGSDGS
jgi:hypothetical protein